MAERVWRKEDIFKEWPRVLKELREAAEVLCEVESRVSNRHKGVAVHITADQLCMALQLAQAEFQRLDKEADSLTPNPKYFDERMPFYALNSSLEPVASGRSEEEAKSRGRAAGCSAPLVGRREKYEKFKAEKAGEK